MKQLVMKDMKLLGMVNFVLVGTLLIGAIIGLMVDKLYIPNYVYGLVSYIIWFMINVNIGGKESKIKSDAFIMSMPVKKFDIVKSRYLTIIIYIFGSLGIMYLISNLGKILFNSMPGRPLTLLGIFVIGATMLMLTSFYIPFHYYDEKSSPFFLVIIQLLVVGSPNIIDRFGIDIYDIAFMRKILTLDFSIVGLILLGASLILYLISLFISKGIYLAKEF